jgi:hypothetical protein
VQLHRESGGGQNERREREKSDVGKSNCLMLLALEPWENRRPLLVVQPVRLVARCYYSANDVVSEQPHRVLAGLQRGAERIPCEVSSHQLHSCS